MTKKASNPPAPTYAHDEIHSDVIQLGHQYKDLLTGLKGIAYANAKNYMSTNRVQLQWADKNGVFQLTWSDASCIVKTKGKPVDIDNSANWVEVELGEKYKDKVHGIEGIAMTVIHYLSGCSRVLIETREKNKIRDNWFEAQRLERTSKPKKVKKSPAKTGGPSKVCDRSFR